MKTERGRSRGEKEPRGESARKAIVKETGGEKKNWWKEREEDNKSIASALVHGLAVWLLATKPPRRNPLL